jgi:nucleoside-diphosphate-sugar epimerase
MRVLICGAGGFLAQAVVEVLAREHSLRLFDARALETSHELVVGDVADFETVQKAMVGCDAIVDVIMAHESTYAGAATKAFDTNVRGMYNLLEAARLQGLRQVVHISTGSVFTGHPCDTLRLTNDTPLRTESPYGLTKVLQEQICQYFADRHGLAITAFRPWGIYDVKLGVSKYGPAAASGWQAIDRYDIAEAVALALKHPGSGFRGYILPGNAAARERHDADAVERDLGWRATRL